MRASSVFFVAFGVASCGNGDSASTPAPSTRASAPRATTVVAASAPPKSPPADTTSTKASATPYFWQKDPAADFPNGGADYCAPVSLSSGLMYLAKARGMSDIAKSTDEKAQIALVNELAKDLATDPKEGTSADGIASGILRFAEARKLGVKRLEIATWRGLSKANEGHRIAQKPDLAWLRAAAADPDTVVLANVGWYKKDPKGFERNNGHWVDVVAAGPGDMGLEIRNSLLRADEQRAKSAVTLTKLDAFDRVDGKSVASMTGYYKVDGPALPYGGATARAVLDAVIVFTPKR